MKQRFLSEIRQTFGLGGFNCSFSERELCDFHNFLEKTFEFSHNTKKGALYVGRQSESNVWVLNDQVHVDSNGEQIPLDESSYVWPGIGGPCIETMFSKGTSHKTDIRSKIALPLESCNSLRVLIEAMTPVLKHNLIPGT